MQGARLKMQNYYMKFSLNKEGVKKLFLPQNKTIKDAMKVIKGCGFGLAIIVEEKRGEEFLGIVTDGDIRRGILKGYRENEPIETVANFHPIVFQGHSSQKIVNAVFHRNPQVKFAPLLNQKREVVGLIRNDKTISFPVAEISLGGNELAYVSEAILTGWISSAGSFVKKFEDSCAKFLGVKYAIACSSGTAALHLAMRSLGIKEGDEVIVPSLTFIATANCVTYVGAKPVFVDAEPEYFTIDVNEIEKHITKRTKAIIPVHLYGHTAKMDSIMKIAKRYKLWVVEDAAEAIGAEFKGEKVGSIGDIGVFSFYGNKIITTGEGGMVTTNNKSVADTVRLSLNHGMSPKNHYWHTVLGYNYRMTNLQAAIGVAQVEHIRETLRKKRWVAKVYKRYLARTQGITLPKEAPWAYHVYWMYPLLIDEERFGISREELQKILAKFHIDTRPFFPPLHRQPIYQKANERLSLPVSERLWANGIYLPSSVNLLESDIQFIAEKIKTSLRLR